MNASAPVIASSRVLAEVSLTKRSFSSVSLSLVLFITPLLSHIMMFSLRTPSLRYMSADAIAAAPAPFITMRTSSILLPAISIALRSAAEDIIAVPCWSSCITGISSSFRSLLSISKHSGDFISSRLIPPKVGAIIFTVSMNFPMSSVFISMS